MNQVIFIILILVHKKQIRTISKSTLVLKSILLKSVVLLHNPVPDDGRTSKTDYHKSMFGVVRTKKSLEETRIKDYV